LEQFEHGLIIFLLKLRVVSVCTAASSILVGILGANNFRQDLNQAGMDCWINAILFNACKSLSNSWLVWFFRY